MARERVRGEIFKSHSYKTGKTLYWTYLAEKKRMKTLRGEYVVHLLVNCEGKIDWYPIEALESLDWI